MASATLKPAPIGAVLIDVHGTLVTPRDMGKTDLLARVIVLVTGHKVDGSRARRVTNAIRRELNATRAEEFLNTDAYWVEVNVRMMRELGCEIDEAQALAIHVHLMGGKLYKMHPKRKEFTRWLLRMKFAGLTKIVVASNSRRDTVEETLRTEEIYDLFKEIYTAERLKVSKPAPKFWRSVLADLDLPADRVLMVGNSLLNDAVAAKEGIHTVLILDRFDAAEAKEEKRLQLSEHAQQTGVRVFASEHLQRVRQFITQNFVPRK